MQNGNCVSWPDSDRSDYCHSHSPFYTNRKSEWNLCIGPSDTQWCKPDCTRNTNSVCNMEWRDCYRVTF
jgi:hypothetical protein